MNILLRLDHRIHRDKRITTHLFLTARILNIDKAIYTGDKDKHLEDSINQTTDTWGGNFKIEHRKDWKKTIKEYKSKNYKVIHLTMYGLKHRDKIKELRELKNNLLFVVGGSKVPGELFSIADYNIAIGNQPHSEVSALAILLYDLYPDSLYREFKNQKLKINPSDKGKNIIVK